MNHIPMTQEVEINESVCAALKSIIPLAQEPE